MRICCHRLPKRFTDSKISEAFTIWASWSVRSGTLGCSFPHINYTLVVKQPLLKMMEIVKWYDDIDDIPKMMGKITVMFQATVSSTLVDPYL